jgi:hypothetical protein
MLKILFIGDIVGESGVELTRDLVPRLKHNDKIDLCIANAENAHNGKGISKTLAQQLMENGVDVITTGNHVWDKQSIAVLKEERLPILRPANYPPGNPGKGYTLIEVERGFKIGVINLQARSFMYSIDCPFRKADEILQTLQQETMFIIVDFHAETTAEKQALAWYLDGRVSAVIGTHTHVQTADERILPRGTGYLTDVGMTGPFDSVIGMNTEVAIKRFLLQTPEYYAVAENNLRLNGVQIHINLKNGKSQTLKRINYSKAEYGKQ